MLSAFVHNYSLDGTIYCRSFHIYRAIMYWQKRLMTLGGESFIKIEHLHKHLYKHLHKHLYTYLHKHLHKCSG